MVSYRIGPADCGPSGLFYATFDMKPGDPLYQYSIDDANGKQYFSGAIAYSPADSARIVIPAPESPAKMVSPPPNSGLPTGTYILKTIGSGGCITTLLTFTIPMVAYELDVSHIVIHKDVCGLNMGDISGLNTIGRQPYNPKYDHDPNHGYFWMDSTGKRIGGLQYLAGVPAGKYTVYAVNYYDCRTLPMTFTVPDSVSTAAMPILDDIKICLPAKVALSVKNQDAEAHYYLYDADKNLIDSAKTGYFVRKVNETTIFYTGAVNGICVSPLGKVVITVVNPGVSFPNTFTPNNDGINDNWNITGLDQYPGTEVSVFDRTGARVYHTINYDQPFDGRLNGANLPAGTYYYIIDTKKPGCQGGITGNITMIR